jgi:hypothetical protein
VNSVTEGMDYAAMAGNLRRIADSNSDLYQDERMWLTEAAAVLEQLAEGNPLPATGQAGK